MARKAALESFELAEGQYASGLIDYQRLIDAQRSLISANDQIVQSRGEVLPVS